MIRRHFFAGAVGLALCAAAALAVGAGQAQAATVDRVTLTLTGEYHCFYSDGDCSGFGPVPSFDCFYGLPVGQAITGWLSIGDPDEHRNQAISFTVNDFVYRLGGQFIDYFSDRNYHQASDCCSFLIAWNGATGSISYMDDASPWSTEVYGTISIAPVPLPAAAALLPLSLGALAWIRRRRRLA